MAGHLGQVRKIDHPGHPYAPEAARLSATIIPLSPLSAQLLYPAEGALVKLESSEIWIAVAVAVSVAIVLVVLWFLVGPVLQLDGARWMS